MVLVDKNIVNAIPKTNWQRLILMLRAGPRKTRPAETLESTYPSTHIYSVCGLYEIQSGMGERERDSN